MTFVAKLGGVITVRPKAARLRDPPPKDVFGSFPYLQYLFVLYCFYVLYSIYYTIMYGRYTHKILNLTLEE